MASGDNHELGERVIIGGLFVQLTIFGFFVFVAALFHHRLRRDPTPQASEPIVRWQTYLTTLYVTGVLIWVRSLFRVIEFIQGNDGELMRSEVYVFVFDGLLMLAVLTWTNWFHPSEIGLLLRGSRPSKNGLELLMINRGGEKSKLDAFESLSSSNAALAGQRQ